MYNECMYVCMYVCMYAHVYVTVHAFIINYTSQHISVANKHDQTVV